MAKTATMTIDVDSELKAQADSVLQFMGITVNEAVANFLQQVILNRELHYVRPLHEYNDETLEALEEAKQIAENGPFRFKNSAEMFAALGI